MLDDVTWQALTIVLTLLAGGWTYYAWQHRGRSSAVRGAGLTLLPVSAYLTGTLKVAGRTADAVADWATGLVFSPVVWVGFALFGISVLLFLLAGWMSGREAGSATPAPPRKTRAAKERKPLNEGTQPKGEPAIDDDLADIEAILKKRGIN